MLRLLLPALSLLLLAGRARADPSPSEERARLLAEYERTHDPSTGCSLGEVERRAGMLDAAAARLGAILATETERRAGHQLREEPFDETATSRLIAACAYNLGHVHEDRGELPAALRRYREALETPIPARRAVVETSIVRVAARRAASEGCRSLGSAIRARALLRFRDDATLRACVRELERAAPPCLRIPADELAERAADSFARRALAPELVVVGRGGLVTLLRMRGARATSGLDCDLALDENASIGTARLLQLGSTRLVLVQMVGSVTSACDCEEGEESDDCRCEESTTTWHLLGVDGSALLSVVDGESSDQVSMAAPEWGDALAREVETSAGVTSEGTTLVLFGRRLVLSRGALVPASARTAEP